MSSLRILTAVLLMLVMPIQGVAMARMLGCDPAFESQAQDTQSVDRQPGDQRVSYVASGTNHEYQTQDKSAEYPGSLDGHDCVECSLCAMSGSTLVSTAISFALPSFRSPKPQGLFRDPAVHFPDSLLHIPVIGVA